MIYNKRGWMRILEATIAVLIVSSVLVIVYSNQQRRGVGPGDYLFDLQKQILMDISLRNDLRRYVLEENEAELNNFAGEKVPSAFRYRIEVCDLDEVGKCKMNSTYVGETKDKEVFVEETIISSNFDGYAPKKVRLFIWENR